MKALLVGAEWFPNIKGGGMHRYFYEAVHALPAVGVTGTALVTEVRPGQAAPMELRGMAAPGASLWQRGKGARRIVRDTLREGVDVVNSHFALYAYSWVNQLPAQTPFIVNFQGPWADELALEKTGWQGQMRVRLARAIEHRVYRRANHVITLSQAFRDIAHARYGIPLERLHVIPGSFDPAPYLAAPDLCQARQRLGWPQERPILLTVRRLVHRMGLENLIDALTEVRRAYPDVLLCIGGRGPIAEQLQARVVAQGLEDNVRFLGFISDTDLPTTYAAANLAVVPTIALEGFGLVTVEALASGTPVLGTAVGGTQEILRELDPRLLFESPTPEAMANKMIAALSGRMILPEPSQCRAFAARYGWNQVAPQIRALFDAAQEASRG